MQLIHISAEFPIAKSSLKESSAIARILNIELGPFLVVVLVD